VKEALVALKETHNWELKAHQLKSSVLGEEHRNACARVDEANRYDTSQEGDDPGGSVHT
jgi:hypothetical protein